MSIFTFGKGKGNGLQYYEVTDFLENHPIISTIFGCDGIHSKNGLFHIAPFHPNSSDLSFPIGLGLYILYYLIFYFIWYKLNCSWTIILVMTGIFVLYSLWYISIFFSFYTVWKYKYTYRFKRFVAFLMTFLSIFMTYSVINDYLEYKDFIKKNNLSNYSEEALIKSYYHYSRIMIKEIHKSKVVKETNEIYSKITGE